ncbi:glutathione S-transferase family protein [Neptuniibacter halophilus]|uniref:glutathione S-transferase family protein n=1 Tax=Neptuniibacter halophilus TaxID=651666 RepID=UPI00257424AD|nr:glutathione S-transferase family protein [Neptuniibacter halophilus]
MYSLYFLPDACSLATQVVLRELNQEVKLINRQNIADFHSINPAGVVPVLMDGTDKHTEGAAILLFLLNRHPNRLFPSSPQAQQDAIENIMFANATMHPAYGRLFFAAANSVDSEQRQILFAESAALINQLWQVVAQKLADQPYLGGLHPSAADILLTVYSRWGDSFPVEIDIPENCRSMINRVLSLPSFVESLKAEAALVTGEKAI